MKSNQKKSRNYGNQKSVGVSEHDIACRKLFKGHIIPCPLISSFFILFTEAFDTAVLDERMLVQKETSCDFYELEIYNLIDVLLVFNYTYKIQLSKGFKCRTKLSNSF